jgi:hypothetical protein
MKIPSRWNKPKTSTKVEKMEGVDLLFHAKIFLPLCRELKPLVTWRM